METSDGQQSSQTINGVSEAEGELKASDCCPKADGDLREMLDECSVVAQEMKKTIFQTLESRGMLFDENSEESEKGASDDPNSSIRQKLENEIREKIVDLESALRSVNSPKRGRSLEPEAKGGLAAQANGKGDLKEKSPPTTDRVPAAAAGPPAAVVKSEKKVSKESATSSPSGAATNCVKDAATDVSKDATKDVPKATVNSKSVKKASKVSSLKKTEQKEKATIEHVLKSLQSCSTDQEKLATLCKRYVDIMETNKTLELHSKQHEKICLQLIKEKEQLQSEHNRVVLAKSRLESLCRELQRHNKAIKEDSLMRIKEEEERHREGASKFQGTLNDIMALVQENQQRNNYLREENIELAKKLKALMEHYEKWEKNIEKILQQKELETQLTKAKLAKTNLLLNEEKEHLLEEKQKLIGLVADYQKRSSESTNNEMQLRSELSLYTSKYEDFQKVLTKSNEMFHGFKKDMESMSKQIKKLEKETAQWRSKWEASNNALLVLAEEKQKRDTELLKALQKVQTLEKLCRAMQEERLQMQLKLKEDGDKLVTGDESLDSVLTEVLPAE